MTWQCPSDSLLSWWSFRCVWGLQDTSFLKTYILMILYLSQVIYINTIILKITFKYMDLKDHKHLVYNNILLFRDFYTYKISLTYMYMYIYTRQALNKLNRLQSRFLLFSFKILCALFMCKPNKTIKHFFI